MKKFVLSLAFLSVLFVSCSDDDDNNLDETEVENEEEVITNVVITLVNGDDTVELVAIDEDANREIDSIDGGTLLPNTEYIGSISLTNEIEDEDITEEIADEDEDHQFFFENEGGLDAVTAYNDADEDGNPLGLMFTLTTGEVSGDYNIVLRHLLDKDADGVSEGDITNAGGETELNVSFPITIEAAEVVAAE